MCSLSDNGGDCGFDTVEKSRDYREMASGDINPGKGD